MCKLRPHHSTTRRLRASFNIDATKRSASGRCVRRSADSLRWRLFLGIHHVGIHYVGIHYVGIHYVWIYHLGIHLLGIYIVEFRRGLDRIGRVLLQ